MQEETNDKKTVALNETTQLQTQPTQPTQHITNLIFQLRIASDDSIRCKFVGSTHLSDSQLTDDIIEIATPEEMKDTVGPNVLLIGNIGKYTITSKYCICNISQNYLLSSTKLPLYYLTILYDRQFVSGCLFNIFVYFTMSTKSHSEVTTLQQYNTSPITGIYTIEIVPLDDDFLTKVQPFINDQVFAKYLDEFAKCTEDGQPEIMQRVTSDIDKLTARYADALKKYVIVPVHDTIPFTYDPSASPTIAEGINTTTYNALPTNVNKNKLLAKLREIAESPEMTELYVLGLKLREHERNATRGIDESRSYTIPKNIINLSDIKNNPDHLDDIMAARGL